MWKCLFALFFLVGCTAHKTPVEEVVLPAIKAVEESIDYAKNNIPETEDTRFLLSSLEGCHVSLISCEAISDQVIESKDKEIKNRELMIIIAAVLAFVLGRALKV